MSNTQDTYSLDGFIQDCATHLERLRATGRPEVLTVNGKASVVIQDAGAYQRLTENLDIADAVRILQDRVETVGRGVPGVSARAVLEEVRNLLGIDPA